MNFGFFAINGIRINLYRNGLRIEFIKINRGLLLAYD
jgi:hypothetical protein